MADDKARLNLKTLAKHLGLSITTVSRALRDGPEVKRETVERVQKAAAELGYVRDLGGLKLRTGLSYTLSVLVNATQVGELANTGAMSLLEGIHDVAHRAGYAVTAVPLSAETDPIDTIRTIVDGRRADGLIFDRTMPMDGRVRFLLERDFPFVSFGRTELFTPHPWFDIDDEDASYRATRLLIAAGHRRIALVNAPLDFMYSQYRVKGYRRALDEAGIPVDAALIYAIDQTARTVRMTVASLVAGGGRPDAFVCSTDMACLGTLAGLRDVGFDPRDFGVASSSGTLLPDYLDPQPVNFYFSLHEAGMRLARLLLRRLDGEATHALQELAVTEMIAPPVREQGFAVRTADRG